MKIPITKPFFEDDDKAAVNAVLDTGWIVQGPRVAEFERLFANFVGAEFAVATTSCTTALHLSLMVAGIGPGDEVILPSFTFVATANAVEYTGAQPVLCDIRIDTFNIDVEYAQKCITKRTKAIIPVHLFGLCADMDSIIRIAKEKELVVIEDAACAFGSRYNGRHAGSLGFAGCFSFHPRKAITTGEGGIVATNNAETDSLLRSLRDHGASKSDLERDKMGGSLLPAYNVLGYNYRMTDLQGALGVSQMNKAERILNERIKRAEIYNENLTEIDWLKPPKRPEGFMHSYQSYVCMIDKNLFGGSLKRANEFRNNLMKRLEALGISTRQGTHAVHTLGYYRDKYSLAEGDFPSSLEADHLSITLPLYPQMTEIEQETIIERLKSEGRKLLSKA